MQFKITTRRLCLCVLLVTGVYSQEAFGQSDDGDVVGRFKIDLERGVIVPVVIDGKEYPFELDTGCTVSVIDLKLLTGKPISEKVCRGLAGDRRLPYYAVPKASLGNRDLQRDLSVVESGDFVVRGWIDPRGLNIGVIGYDFSELNEQSGRQFYGLLGMDFLHQWAVQIDFDHDELLIMRKAVVPENADVFDLYYDDGGRALVRCRIADWGEADFGIDTGLEATGNFESRFASVLEQQKCIENVGRTRGLSITGAYRKGEFGVPKFALGNHECPDLHFSEGTANIVGLWYLCRYNLTLDFPNKKLYVVESSRFNSEENRNVSGLHLVSRQGKTIVIEIDEGSPAEKSGLKAGDQILRVANLEASGEQLSNIRELLCHHEISVRVNARRDETQFKATVDLP